MTFCCAMKVRDGLVALADTRITSGSERTTAHKITIHQFGHHPLFLMTSGLRTVRDKAITYFDEALEEGNGETDKLYKAVNQLAKQVRRVAAEDKQSLAESGFHFDLHAVVGGQLEHDSEPKLYLLYPQGNWVEVTQGTPYFIIGESGYGKPLLDRALRDESSIETALKIGFLAFDATKTSAVDVDYPIDVVLYKKNSYVMVEHRYNRQDLAHVADWWEQLLFSSMSQLPNDWAQAVMAKLPQSKAVAEPPLTLAAQAMAAETAPNGHGAHPPPPRPGAAAKVRRKRRPARSTPPS